jgi:biotin transport system substrate-specific component
MTGDYNRSVIITHTSLFIALTAVFSWISIPFFPVPLTLQTLAVLLTGTIMKRYAGIVMLLYILLGILGLPVFHNGTAGIGVLLGPTGGYLLGFIPAAFILGILYEKTSNAVRIAGLGIATFLIYLCGVMWLIISVPLDPFPAVLTGMLPFIPGDIVKAAAAFLITMRFEAYFPRINVK